MALWHKNLDVGQGLDTQISNYVIKAGLWFNGVMDGAVVLAIKFSCKKIHLLELLIRSLESTFFLGQKKGDELIPSFAWSRA